MFQFADISRPWVVEQCLFSTLREFTLAAIAGCQIAQLGGSVSKKENLT